YASSLCGACTAVCPVKIDIHNLLLLNRKQSIEEKQSTWLERRGFKFWKKAMLHRKRMNRFSGKLKTHVIKFFFGNTWGKRRKNIKIAPKSFNELWKERMEK
ncbi:MAG: [Fe-S]-binding protein, partial [Bacteroidota bacterium]